MHESDELTQGLIERLGWTRRLAAGLITDAGLADDLVQDAWVEFLRRPPRQSSSLVGWVTQVVRNLARQETRRRRRGAELERDNAQCKVGEAAADGVARAEAHRALIEAVFALRRADRDIVLLRFFEDLSSHAIGERLGLDPSTVRSRLQRGLSKLREWLETRHGAGPRTWLSALLPLLPHPRVIPPVGRIETSSLPEMGMGAGTALAFAIVALTATGRFFSPSRDKTAPVATLTPLAPLPTTSVATTDGGSERAEEERFRFDFEFSYAFEFGSQPRIDRRTGKDAARPSIPLALGSAQSGHAPLTQTNRAPAAARPRNKRSWRPAASFDRPPPVTSLELCSAAARITTPID